MSEKLCLQWNEFQENVKSFFSRLRDDKEFTDVTLACENGEQIEAHKVVLASSSPFFENILQRNKHPHPLIYLKGFKSQDLLDILDFLYFGEANVSQENLDSFLEIATELKLKGLASPTSNDDQTNTKLTKTTKEAFGKALFNKSFSNELVSSVHAEENVSTVLASFDQFSVDLQALDEKVKSMMEKSQNIIPHGNYANGKTRQQNAFICKMCGKEDNCTIIKYHIESTHLEGISIPCAFCEKTCPTRNALVAHKSRYHRAQM